MLFHRFKYYEQLDDENVMYRQPIDGGDVYKFVNGGWSFCEKSEWSKLRLAYISEDVAKKRVKQLKKSA